MFLSLFIERDELKIGKIIEVYGSTIKVELDRGLGNLKRTIDGRVYPVGQMTSIIKVHFGRKLIFGIITMLRMKTEVDVLEEREIIPGDDSRILEADLFAEGYWNESKNELSFIRGVESFPLPLQHVYLTTKDEMERIYQGAEQTLEPHIDPMVPIGTYIGSNAVCRANIDKLFGNHCAILGSTGVGKSATVAAILHSVLDYKDNEDVKLFPRIVLIDPHGEYASAFSSHAVIYRAYSHASAGGDNTTVLKLPYWLMTGDELRSLLIGKTEHEATSQNNIIYEALSYARMVQSGVIDSLGDNPMGNQVPNLSQGKVEADRDCFDRDKPLPFRLTEMIRHINLVQGRKPNTTNDRSFSDRQKLDSVLRKIRVLQSNPQLKFLLEEYIEKPIALEEVLAQFVGRINGSDHSLRIIDISGLPNEVSGPLTAMITRLLFQYKLWQTPEERAEDPILICCEEAHKYVPNHGEAQYKEAQESIRRVAREGRKYGIGLLLVSQRPSDLESTVLSQCNSWIVLRLTNSRDQEHVNRFLPDNLSGLTRILPSLTRREAIFIGEAAVLPSRIKIRELEVNQLPNSSDISFVSGWKNELLECCKLNEVVQRWTRVDT